jgi:hypothetical protein
MVRSNVIDVRIADEGKQRSFEFGHEGFAINLRNEIDNMMLKP